MAQPRIVVQGIRELQMDLRRSLGAYPREVTRALKNAGQPVLERASASMPHVSGRLAGSLGISVRGATASITSRAPYAGGAEWGRFGKWSGFDRYGSPPRFVFPAVEASAERLAEDVARELRNVLSAYGWFQGSL